VNGRTAVVADDFSVVTDIWNSLIWLWCSMCKGYCLTIAHHMGTVRWSDPWS
jgi:hypothetical protein